jgi:hypothetical protein
MEENTYSNDIKSAIMLAKATLSLVLILLITIIYPNWTVFFLSWLIVPPLVFIAFLKK